MSEHKRGGGRAPRVGAQIKEQDRRLKTFTTSIAPGQKRTFTIHTLRNGPVSGVLNTTPPAASAVRVHFVRFHTRWREEVSRFNSRFSLRFYLPPHRSPVRLDRLFIFLNGFSEATTNFWDGIGESFARAGIASVLLPLPNHFCRNIFFNLNCFDPVDSFRLSPGADVDITQFTSIMKCEMIENAEQVINFNHQLLDDIAKLADCLHKPTFEDEEICAFMERHFTRDARISLMGYSLGGLCALQAYLTQPELYSSCILVNSGASFQDMDGSSMFGQQEWREIQKSLVRAARKVGSLSEKNFFSHVILGHDRVELREHLANNCHKILVLLGGRDRIINFKNVVNIEPSETDLAIFQVPALEHFINIRSIAGREWHSWSEFAVRMILAFDRYHPPNPALPPRPEPMLLQEQAP